MFARSILIVLLLPSICLAQIDLSATKSKAIAGLFDPQIVAGRILVAEKSTPTVAEVAIIQCVAPAKFVRVKARKSLYESVELTRIDDTHWLLEGTGRFSVEATSFDPEVGVDEAQIEVILGGVGPPPPPVEPPTNPGNFADIAKVSRDGASSLNDPLTANRLVEALKAIQPKIASMETLQVAQSAVVLEIETVLRQRTGESRTKDWLGLWRRPLNNAIEAAKASGRIKSPSDYAAVVAAMATGLESQATGGR